jgi:hypothetical protein
MSTDGLTGRGGELRRFAKSDGNTMALSAYSQSQFRISESVTANVGVHAQYFALNGKATVEPRAGIRWQAAPRHAFSIAYGMHSRRENTDYYFVKSADDDERLVNKNLGFAKAHHLVMSYDWSIGEHLRLKVEPYWQHLYDVPVEPGTMLSMINYRDFWMMIPLVNEGKGRNYGVDMTLERYLHNGWYYLLTGSVFSSRYTGGDGVWRNTRLNRSITVNALGGKEWRLGGKNMLNVSLRFAYLGGERYIPFDEAASVASQSVVYDDAHAYDDSLDPQFVAHFTVGYKINRERTAHTITLQMINASGTSDYNGDGYSYQENKPIRYMSYISIPNISYKVEF